MKDDEERYFDKFLIKQIDWVLGWKIMSGQNLFRFYDEFFFVAICDEKILGKFFQTSFLMK